MADLAIGEVDKHLVAAVDEGRFRDVQGFVVQGADVNVIFVDPFGLKGWKTFSPLSWAVVKEDDFTVRALLKAGAKLQNREWQQPLWWAARSGNLTIVALLCDHGADLNHQGEGNGTTALHVAIANKHPEVVNYLIGNGADPCQKTLQRNPWGQYDKSPLDFARALNSTDCIPILTKAAGQGGC